MKSQRKFKFFLDDVENAKNDANILKTYFLDFCYFLLFFRFFKKNYQKNRSKIR
jgi:hypothetical protein